LGAYRDLHLKRGGKVVNLHLYGGTSSPARAALGSSQDFRPNLGTGFDRGNGGSHPPTILHQP
jgi:hypothetical protein